MVLEIKAELVLTLHSKQEWISKVPRKLPYPLYYDEKFLWLDKNGYNMAMGGDFQAAETLESYPVSVYRLKRAVDCLNDKDQLIQDAKNNPNH